jgi:hypothetical protein
MFARNVSQSVVSGNTEDSGLSFRGPPSYSSDVQPDLGKSAFGDCRSALSLKAVSTVDERIEPSKTAQEVNWRYVGTVSLLNTAIAAGVAATVAAHGVALGRVREVTGCGAGIPKVVSA